MAEDGDALVARNLRRELLAMAEIGGLSILSIDLTLIFHLWRLWLDRDA